MDLRRLRYFVRIAGDGSLTRAASALGIPQSALSRQMRLLEDEIGAPLFERRARGMRLTRNGAQLHGAVAGPLREIELAIHGMRGAAAMGGDLAVGLTPGVADCIAGDLARVLAATFPDMHFRFSEGPTGSLVDWLGRGLIDFAVLEGASDHPLVAERLILSLPFCLAAPPDTDIASGPMTLADVFDRPLILPAHHLGIRPIVNDAASRARFRPDVVMEADAPARIRGLVADGTGCALLPARYCRDDASLGRLSLRSLADPVPSLPIFLAWRRTGERHGSRMAAMDGFLSTFLQSRL